MKQLAFVLFLQMWSGGMVTETIRIAVWEDINVCVYFARKISLQANSEYDVPVSAYCIPEYVDPETTEIFK